MQRSRNGRSGITARPSHHAGNGAEPTKRARQRALCIAALPDGDDLSELGELLRTAGVAVAGELVQRREQPHPNTYLGPGKVEEIKTLARACDANLVACDDELSARQEHTLEEALGLPVVDRTTVILDIFASHAGTAEGKLQVELAQLEYNLARMRGLWSHLERLGGGIGTRGPGETQIETDRRLARDRIATLRRRLEHVKGTRAVQRAERERAALPTVAPVGYISKLPHQLVDAFGATLEETSRAELLAHVLDGSASEEQMEIMRRSVEETLEEIGAGERPRLLVLNKIDLLDDAAREDLRLRHPDAVFVSGVTGEGLEELGVRIERELAHTLRRVDLLVPYADGGSLAELHEAAGEVSREDTAEGVRVRALVPARLAGRFSRFSAPARL